jgi:hypothetical protein
MCCVNGLSLREIGFQDVPCSVVDTLTLWQMTLSTLIFPWEYPSINVPYYIFHSLTTDVILILTHLLIEIGLTPGGSSMLHIYTQTVHRTTQLTTLVGRLSGIRTQSGQTKINDELTAKKSWPNWDDYRPCPVFASYILAFALQLRKKYGKPSVRVAEECQLARWKQNIQNRTIKITLANWHVQSLNNPFLSQQTTRHLIPEDSNITFILSLPK